MPDNLTRDKLGARIGTDKCYVFCSYCSKMMMVYKDKLVHCLHSDYLKCRDKRENDKTKEG